MTSYLRGNPYLCDKQYKSIPKPPLSLFYLIMTCTKGTDHGLIGGERSHPYKEKEAEASF